MFDMPISLQECRKWMFHPPIVTTPSVAKRLNTGQQGDVLVCGVYVRRFGWAVRGAVELG